MVHYAHRFLIIFYLLITHLILFAQNSSAIIDSSAIKENPVYDFVLFDARYQNQYAFWGRNYGQRIPLATATLSYYFHSNIWIGASAFLPLQSAVPVQTGLSIGFYKEFTDKCDWNSSYSQFYIPDNSIPSSSKTQGYFQTTVGLDWGVLYSTLQAHLLVNNNSDVFFSTHHSRYFEFNKKLWQKIKVSFEPKFSFTFGTHHFDFADAEVVIGPGGGAAKTPQSSTDQDNRLRPLNWDFLLPIKFEIGKFTLEPSYRYTVPLSTTATDPSKSLFLFSSTLGYYIPVKK